MLCVWTDTAPPPHPTHAHYAHVYVLTRCAPWVCSYGERVPDNFIPRIQSTGNGDGLLPFAFGAAVRVSRNADIIVPPQPISPTTSGSAAITMDSMDATLRSSSRAASDDVGAVKPQGVERALTDTETEDLRQLHGAIEMCHMPS